MQFSVSISSPTPSTAGADLQEASAGDQVLDEVPSDPFPATSREVQAKYAEDGDEAFFRSRQRQRAGDSNSPKGPNGLNSAAEVEVEADVQDEHDEYSALLRRTQDDVPAYFREKPQLFTTAQSVSNSNYALLFLGLSEFVVSFLAGAPGFVGSYAMYLLGSFGLGIGVLSMLANAAVRQLERDVKKGMEMLAFFFNMGSLLVVSFGCWSVTVLVMSSLFWTYVGLHWDGNVEHSFPGFSASEAETHVQLTVISVGVLSLFSCCILILSLRGAAAIQSNPIVDEQLYLCVNLVLGMSGALLVGVTILTLYHESSIPIAPHESWLLLVLGLFLFCAALAGVFRLFFWRAGHRADYSFYHVTALCLLTMVMACACMVLLHRAFNVERYLKEDNPFSRFGMLTTEGEDDVRKLKLSARIQLILLGVTTIIITLYSTLATLFAFQFTTITARSPSAAAPPSHSTPSGPARDRGDGL